MSIEEIVNQILVSRPDLKREDILRKIEEKRTEAGGFFTEEAAARLVALDLGVEVSVKESTPPIPLIEKLVPGLNDVTVAGRVIIVYPPKTFTQVNGTEKQLAKLLIADKSGTLNVVLWNSPEEKLKQIKQGRTIRAYHGYVREDLEGKLELHLGSRGSIEVSPQDIEEKDFPPISNFINKIGTITQKQKKANVMGVVQKAFPLSTFQRQNGTTGKVMRLQLKDETGQITVVFWNEKADEFSNIKKDDILQIMNAKLKKRLDGQLELHTENATSVERINEAAVFVQKKATHIKDLKEGDGPIIVEGMVATMPVLGEVTLKGGEKACVTTFQLADETGKIWVSAWRKLAEKTKNLKTGTKIIVKNAFIRKGFANQLEITTRALSTIEIIA